MQREEPTFIHAAVTFGSIITVIGIGLFILHISLHSLILICLTIAAGSAWMLKHDNFSRIREAMNDRISRAFPAMLLLKTSA